MAIPLLGTVALLANNTGTFSLQPKTNFWFIQNQDVAPLKIQFLGPRSGLFSSLVLASAINAGGPGGYIDSIGFPYFDPLGFTLSSIVAAALFGSGQSLNQPVNAYGYPGSPGGQQ